MTAMGEPEGVLDTKLHEAVRSSDVDEVRLALCQGFDPNLIGLYQWNPLHEAAHAGDDEILELLLEYKGDPNKQDYLQSRTAVHYAAEGGHVKCLKMLVDAGGRHDIRDASGKNCLDLATPGGRRILERLRVRELMQMSTPDARKSVQDNQGGRDEGISKDIHTPTVVPASKTDLIPKPDGPVLGYVNMSVEHHSGKATVRIRVWQVSDLLLPPANTSMIHSIYVKSYLQPDKKKETKRKTEEVKVEGSEGHIHWKKRKDLSIQHVYAPVTYKFQRALEYDKVTREIIHTRHLQIEVCMTQRYTHRSFLIGMLNLPMKDAVKLVVRGKYPLIPCMNHTIPSNMKVYSASELQIMSSSAKVFYSNPNFRLLIPDDSDDDSSLRAISNPDLKAGTLTVPSMAVDIPLDSGPVPRLNLDSLTLDESGYGSEHHISFPGELDSPDRELPQRSLSLKQNFRTVDMHEKEKGKLRAVLDTVKKSLTPRGKAVTHLSEGLKVEDIENDVPEEVKIEQQSDKKVEEWKFNDIKQSTQSKTPDSGSRPETPTWDYFEMPLEVVADNISISGPPQSEALGPVVLPMQTTMKIHGSGKDPDETEPVPKERKKKKLKKKPAVVPGRAVPLVPEIIVTNSDSSSGTKSQQHTVVPIPASVTDTAKHTEAPGCISSGDTSKHVEIPIPHSTHDSGKYNTEGKEKPLVFSTKSKKKEKRVKNTTKSAEEPQSTKVEIFDYEMLQSQMESSGDSHTVDMATVSRQSSESFVVDVDVDDISDRSELFSEMSVATAMETATGEDLSFSSQFPALKHVIPMQVFIEDHSDSCDESLPLDSVV